MKYVAPGLRELARVFDRSASRLCLAWLRPGLARAESTLGLLGWQQADFDGGTQQHVDRLTDFERAQALLTNESAALGLAIHDLEARRAAERAAFEEERAARTTACKAPAQAVEDSEKTLAAQHREQAAHEERLSALDQEATATEERYRALLSRGSLLPGEESEVQRLQYRVIAIPREKLEWRANLAALTPVIARLESEVQQHRATLSVEREALRVLEKDFARADAALARELADHKRNKQKLERRINDFEKHKAEPYREIGKTLADQGIQPANQPEALAAVLTLRRKIVAREAHLTASLGESAREDRSEVRVFWLLSLIILAVLVGAMFLAARAR